MAIEETVSELIKAIKELNETLKNGGCSKGSKQEKAEPSSGSNKEQPRLEDVRSSLIRLKEARDHETAKSILKSLGVNKIKDLDEKDYQRCIDLCEKEEA